MPRSITCRSSLASSEHPPATFTNRIGRAYKARASEGLAESLVPARVALDYTRTLLAMHFLHHLSLLASLSSAWLLPEPQSILSNPSLDSSEGYRIPTVRESAVMARRILHLTSIGTLSTIFPSSHGTSASTSSSDELTASENRPSSVAGTPIGLMEYFADCEPETGNPSILAVTIATPYKNAAAGSNITLSLRWHPPSWSHYSAASLPRFSLHGWLEDIEDDAEKQEEIKKCYKQAHPDVFWYPGNDIHESKWVRLVVEEVYWFGGFGDRAYIGWIPVDMWRNVTKQEIESIRLPGEKKGLFW